MLRAPKAPGARQDGSRRAPRQASIPAKRLGRSSSRLDAAPGGVVDLKYRSCSTTRPSRRPTANREELRARTRWANFTIRRTKTTIGCEYAEGSTASGYIQSFGDAVATIPYAGPTAICDSAVSPPARVPTNSARRGQFDAPQNARNDDDQGNRSGSGTSDTTPGSNAWAAAYVPASSFTPSTRHLLDGVALRVLRRSAWPARPRRRRELNL